MLKLKYLFENYELAKEALKHWEYDERNLDEMLTQFRISSNAIYPFYQAGQLCFLRLAPVSEKLECNVRGELEFIQYLRSHNYPALQPVPAYNGELCLSLDTDWGKYYAMVFLHVDGVQIEDIDMTDSIAYQYGKALGKLHSLSAEFTPHTKKWTHAEALDWIEHVLQQYSAPRSMLSALNTTRHDLNCLPACQTSYGLVHYDFEPDNVFYDQKSSTCAVIDFDDGMYHWYALDIEQVFNALAEQFNGDALQKVQALFLSGYQSEHCFTAEMRESLPLMRRFVDLFGYARLIRCVAEKFDGEPEWLTDLRTKLNHAIAIKEERLTNL